MPRLPRFRPAFGIFCAYLLLAAIYTSPVLQQSGTAIANDPFDPVLNTSILWWNATTVPFTAAWWNPPYFYPTTGVSAFTENLVGISVFATPIYWLTGNPLSAYNLSFFLTWPLSAFAVYLLGYFLTRRHDAAALAGLSYGFTPYRAVDLGHVQMLSSYWLPIGVLALHGFVADRRRRWLVVFAVVWILQALANGYFIFFGAVFVGLWVVYFCTTRETWRALPPILLTAVVANLALLPILLRYHTIHEAYGLRRTLTEVRWFSAPVSAWWEVSQVVKFWSAVLPESKDNQFPGATVLVLLVVGLCLARWRRPTAVAQSTAFRVLIATLGIVTAVTAALVLATAVLGPWRATVLGVRIRMSELDFALSVLLWCGVPLLLLTTRIVEVLKARPVFVFYVLAMLVMGLLSMGPSMHAHDATILEPMPYRWLMYLPGFDQLRVPSRFWMLGTMCLAVAAALVFSRYAPASRSRRQALFAVLAAGVLVDGWTAGIPIAAAPQQWPKVERRDATEPILELPLGPAWDAAATFRGLRHRRGVVNGVSGYDPPAYAPLQDALNRREADILLALASLRPVDVVVNGEADGDGAIARYVASVPGATLVTTDGVRTVYRVTAPPRPELVLGRVLPIVAALGSTRPAPEAIDGRMSTEWHEDAGQTPGHFLMADLGSVQEVGGVTQSLGEFARDYARRLAIEVSIDGTTWDRVWEGPTAGMAFLAAVRRPVECVMRFDFVPHQARFVRLRPIVAHQNLWRVAELTVHAPAGR